MNVNKLRHIIIYTYEKIILILFILEIYILADGCNINMSLYLRYIKYIKSSLKLISKHVFLCTRLNTIGN